MPESKGLDGFSEPVGAEPDSSQNIEALMAEILIENPLHKSFLMRAYDYLTVDEREQLGRIIAYLRTVGHPMEYIAECYNTFVEDTLSEQLFFLREGRYRYSSYAEVADEVYNNREYMDKYMYGLMVTTFLWPNHVDMARFFRENLPLEKNGSYLEVGPGHGYFMAMAAALGDFDDLVGIDISAASVEQTKSILTHLASSVAQRCDIRLCDFLKDATLEAGGFDAIVAGEVLEHVENPDAFLRRIHELAKDDAFIYVTTCVNAPAVDHIFLWRSTNEFEQLVQECGFDIVAPLRLPYEGKTLEESEAHRLSINVAYVLRKVP